LRTLASGHTPISVSDYRTCRLSTISPGPEKGLARPANRDGEAATQSVWWIEHSSILCTEPRASARAEQRVPVGCATRNALRDDEICSRVWRTESGGASLIDDAGKMPGRIPESSRTPPDGGLLIDAARRRFERWTWPGTAPEASPGCHERCCWRSLAMPPRPSTFRALDRPKAASKRFPGGRERHGWEPLTVPPSPRTTRMAGGWHGQAPTYVGTPPCCSLPRSPCRRFKIQYRPRRPNMQRRFPFHPPRRDTSGDRSLTAVPANARDVLNRGVSTMTPVRKTGRRKRGDIGRASPGSHLRVRLHRRPRRRTEGLERCARTKQSHFVNAITTRD
jgi:hypothetical protein